MGDGLYNFSDGLVIGVVFIEGLLSGLSIFVVVFCYELFYELGDFVVLLKVGMIVKQVVFYNVLLVMLVYFGMVIGIFIGYYVENVFMWIFVFIVGLFMYVVLVDMVFEMLYNDVSDYGCSCWGYFFLQNVGMFLGFGIMLFIFIFEYKIVFCINFQLRFKCQSSLKSCYSFSRLQGDEFVCCIMQCLKLVGFVIFVLNIVVCYKVS